MGTRSSGYSQSHAFGRKLLMTAGVNDLSTGCVNPGPISKRHLQRRWGSLRTTTAQKTMPRWKSGDPVCFSSYQVTPD